MPEYIGIDELKTALAMTGETYADDAIEVAVNSANEACDNYKGTTFAPTETQARTYTAKLGALTLEIDDLNSLTSVTVDADGDGTYEVTWTLGEDFDLEPANAPFEGIPYQAIALRRRGGASSFPRYANSVKVTGSYGWAQTPASVVQAATMIANFLLSSTQGAPMGVIVEAAADTVAMARLGRIHPPAAGLLDLLPGRPTPGKQGLTSVQLG
jgi:hypothetical protein